MATVALACMVKVHKMCRNWQSYLIAISMDVSLTVLFAVCSSRGLPGLGGSGALGGSSGEWGMGPVCASVRMCCVCQGGGGGEGKLTGTRHGWD